MKKVYYGNFNVTFGQENEPMLEYFNDLLYPALILPDVVVKDDEKTLYFVSDVKVEKFFDTHYLSLVFIKKEKLERLTIIEADKLIPSPMKIDSAPYSRILINLRNHRIMLVKNEKGSPTFSSFKIAVSKKIIAYKKFNNIPRNKFPKATISIIDIPLNEDIDNIFTNIRKINELDFKFKPLNNDLPPNMFDFVLEKMLKTSTKNAHTTFNSPRNLEGTKEIVKEAKQKGMVETKIRFIDLEGVEKVLKDRDISTKRAIDIDENIGFHHHEQFVTLGLSDDVFSYTSNENNDSYTRLESQIEELRSDSDE